jgi:hypothetical protein
MITNKKRAGKRPRPPQTRPRWSQEDLRLFLRLYRKTSNFVIARRLRRPLQGITSKAHKLGLKKDAQRLVKMGQENIAHRWAQRRKSRSGLRS